MADKRVRLKGNKSKAVKGKESKVNQLIVKEIISILAIAMSILVILSVFSQQNAGILGGALGSCLRGLFGVGAYVSPFIIISIGIYILFDQKKEIPRYKILIGVCLFLSFISFAHIIGMDETAQFDGAIDYIKTNFTAGGIKNGGLLGALLGNFIVQVVGKVFSYVLLSVLAIVFLMLMTGQSFVGKITDSYFAVKDKLEDVYDIEYDDPPDHLPVKKNRDLDFVIDESKRPKKEFKVLLPGDQESGETKDNKHKPQADGEKQEESILDLDSGDIRFFGISEEPDYDDTPPFIIEAVVAKPTETKSDDDKYSKTEPVEEEPTVVKPVFIQAKIPEETPSVPEELNIEREYRFPPSQLLQSNTALNTGNSKQAILENSRKLEETLKSFGVEARVVEVSKGPSVTRYELSPGSGVKVSRISSLADDLALNLAASGIRIEAPIPGKAAVGIEVPNKETQTVYFREIIEDEAFKKFPSKLAFGLGKDIAGKTVVTDIAKMPHLLIAGATGSGKSVCINTLITSILYKASPEEVKLIMVDPKVVELSVYNGVPHLLIPVVTDAKKAAGALNWAVKEMLKRYEMFAQNAVRDLKGYNAIAENDEDLEAMPQIVIIIDELADLMMAAPGEVEDSICRLAQMARAAGLHLIIATQRPSVDVITGVIKANIPSRLAFAVSSGTDSRTILDMVGAEKLLGRGDMLFYPVGQSKPVRIQGAFISDREVEDIVEYLKGDQQLEYDQKMIDNITSSSKSLEINEDTDEFFEPAVEYIIQKEKASASMLQRQFRIGYNRASRLIEDLELKGIVGKEDGAKPRKVLVTFSQWEEMKNGTIEAVEQDGKE